MIPAAFDYYRPKDMDGVLSLLEEHGDDARVMAGGHSLIPMMKLRMAAVLHLIDLQDVGGMSEIEVGNDSIRIGALVTQADLIEHADLAAAAPILREAALQIADPQVRYMGTVGGNVANGDPGNDMPGLMQCLDAVFRVVGQDGEREIPAREFYEPTLFTELAPQRSGGRVRPFLSIREWHVLRT
jgi:carbon-monoxide dehydrogenase medium subunit